MTVTIRASSLSGYADCPRRSAARLFRQEITAAGYKLRYTMRGIGAAIGSAVHKSAAVALGEKARAGRLPPVTVALDAATDELRYQIGDREIMYDAPRGATQNRRDAELQTVSMSQAYHQHVAPFVHPIIVEERLEAEVEPGLVLSGTPDLVAREPHAIRDLKTSARGPGSHAPQLGAYSLLARSHGLDIERASIDHIQRVPARVPQPGPVTKSVPIEPAETAASNILRTIARDLDVWRNGDPQRRILPGDVWAFPANPSSMLCSARWCPAYGTEFCKEGGAGK